MTLDIEAGGKATAKAPREDADLSYITEELLGEASNAHLHVIPTHDARGRWKAIPRLTPEITSGTG